MDDFNIKHPIPFWIAVAIVVGFWFFILIDNNPDSPFSDFHFRSWFMDGVFFTALSVCLSCLEIEPRYKKKMRIMIIVSLIFGMAQIMYAVSDAPAFFEWIVPSGIPDGMLPENLTPIA